jgi:hypothetical protein
MTLEQPDIDLLRDALDRVNSVWDGDRELDCRIAYAVGMNWCDPHWAYSGTSSWRDHVEKNGYISAWNNDHVFDREDGVPLFSTNLDAGFKLLQTVLPHHDTININCDPSGFGANVGNWYIGENKMYDYAESSCASFPLAFVSAILKAYIGKLTDTGVVKDM